MDFPRADRATPPYPYPVTEVSGPSPVKARLSFSPIQPAVIPCIFGPCHAFMRHDLTPADLHHLHQRHVLRAVATVEFSKGVFVVIMAFCALALLHRDTWVIAERILSMLHVSTDRRWAQVFLDFADNITDARLWDAAGIAFAYASLRFTEAYGLWRQRTWAEWVAFVSGTLLLPFEIRELFRGLTFWRCALLIGNVAIVLYMLYVILDNRSERRIAAAASRSALNTAPRAAFETKDSGNSRLSGS